MKKAIESVQELIQAELKGNVISPQDTIRLNKMSKIVESLEVEYGLYDSNSLMREKMKDILDETKNDKKSLDVSCYDDDSYGSVEAHLVEVGKDKSTLQVHGDHNELKSLKNGELIEVTNAEILKVLKNNEVMIGEYKSLGIPKIASQDQDISM